MVIQIYNPMIDADDEDKEIFYELLQKEIVATPLHDLMILLGNANAEVGSENTGWEGTITDNAKVSLMAGPQANCLSVRTTMPTWFDHLEKKFSSKSFAHL